MSGCSVRATAGIFAKPVDEVPDAFRQSGLLGDLGQDSCRERRELRRFVDHVQPAASAGAIFQVDSMNGVFHGVITPTGPIGDTGCDVHLSVGEAKRLAITRACRCPVGEEAEVLRTAQCRFRHETQGLAGVPCIRMNAISSARCDNGVGNSDEGSPCALSEPGMARPGRRMHRVAALAALIYVFAALLPWADRADSGFQVNRADNVWNSLSSSVCNGNVSPAMRFWHGP